MNEKYNTHLRIGFQRSHLLLAIAPIFLALGSRAAAQTEISVNQAPWDQISDDELADLGGDILAEDSTPGEDAWPPPEINCGNPPSYDEIDESIEDFFDVDTFDGDSDKPAGWSSGDAGGTSHRLTSDGANVIRMDEDKIEEILGEASGDVESLRGALGIIVWHELHHAPGGAPYHPPVSEDGCDHAGLNYWTLMKACREARRWRFEWESGHFPEMAWGRFVGACIMEGWLRKLLDPNSPRGKKLVECCEELQPDADGVDPCTVIFPLPAGCPPVLPTCTACEL